MGEKYSGYFVVENYLNTSISGQAQQVLGDSGSHSPICTFSNLAHNQRTPTVAFTTETGHGDYWVLSFVVYGRLFVVAKKCDYKTKDAPNILILRLAPDGNEIKLKVICPESGDCSTTVEL
ncbi:MAG: hypothetical protein AAF614_05920 [Chloroflexota bacterium]